VRALREWSLPVDLRIFVQIPFRVVTLNPPPLSISCHVSSCRVVSLQGAVSRVTFSARTQPREVGDVDAATRRGPTTRPHVLARWLAAAAAAAGGGASGRRRREQSSARCDANRAEIVGVGPGPEGCSPRHRMEFNSGTKGYKCVRDAANMLATQQHTGEPFHLE